VTSEKAPAPHGRFFSSRRIRLLHQGKSPRVILAVRTFSTPIAMAAVRWEI
jgi:hypothetical protein